MNGQRIGRPSKVGFLVAAPPRRHRTAAARRRSFRLAPSRREDGFTIVEVIMASLIFLIAFSSLMTLMMAVTTMNVKAKEKATMTNAANSYIEQARALGFNSIGTSGGNPAGTLTETTVTVSGFTVHIKPTVTWIDDPKITGTQDYKKLTLIVTIVSGGTTPSTMTYVAETIIKKTDTGTNTSAVPPTIDFTSDSPANTSTVEGISVVVGAVATANGDNVTLASMNFYCDGIPLMDYSRDTAQWSISAASITRSFNWDTTAQNDDHVPLSIDGWHTLKVEAWDSNGKQAFAQRRVFVDNAVPPPTSIVATLTAGTNTFNVSWPAVMDGNTPVDHYILTIDEQGPTATGGDLTGWSPVLAPTSHLGTNAAFTPVPFSRYYFYLLTATPGDHLVSPSGVATVAISRPSIEGTWTQYTTGNGGGRWMYTTNHLTLNPNTFPCSYGPVNTLYRATNAAMTSNLTALVTGTGWTYTDAIPGYKVGNGNATQYYYQVKTMFTPAGYAGGTPVTMWSNVVGTNGIAAGSGIMNVAAW